MQRIMPMLSIAALCLAATSCGGEPEHPSVNGLLSPSEIEQSQHGFGPNQPAIGQGKCSGTPAACGTYTSPASCNAVSGCEAAYSVCAAKACHAFTDAATCYANRCTWRFLCGGKATACYQAGRDTCVRQAGCTWIAETGVCSGIERSCNTFNDPVSCVAQGGCGVLRGCMESLAAPACLLNTTEAKCRVNNACTWEPDSCGGTPAPCSAQVTAATCRNVTGCAWTP